MNYYNFHIGDYISHTIHLSIEEDLAYRRLLDMYYDTELPIPNNIPLVSRKLRISAEVVKTVLDEFFELTDEGFKNFRAENEIAEYQRFIEKQKANGSKGGRPKKSQRKPTANPTQSQKKPNQEPITINHKPIKETAIAVCPINVQEQVWLDFLALRKAKKAPMTVTALAGIKREADKANWDLNKAISECVSRGWIGFKAEWVEVKQTYAQQALDVARTTVPSSSQRDPALQKLDEDFKNAKPNPEIIAKIKEAFKGKLA
jgi:uncharacterized protein YdaU (DUF1376 family)